MLEDIFEAMIAFRVLEISISFSKNEHPFGPTTLRYGVRRLVGAFNGQIYLPAVRLPLGKTSGGILLNRRRNEFRL